MSQKFTLNIDLRMIVAALLIIIVAMLAVWQPWGSGNQRKITVTGQATIKATPDSYVFYPTYTQSGSNRQAALSTLNKKASTITEKLKQLGVKESDIQLQSSSYPQYYPESESKQDAVSLSLTIKVTSKDMAQKVQDYLLTTTPGGSITPVPEFSEEKRRQLQNEAREKAVDDARIQAERTAKQAGARLGKVIEINDSAGGDIILPYAGKETRMAVDDGAQSGQSLPILPGEQEVNFSVQAVFAIH